MTGDMNTGSPRPIDDGHAHEWERGKRMAEAFGIPGNVSACALCGVEKRVYDNAGAMAAAVHAHVTASDAATAVDGLPDGSTIESVTVHPTAAERLARMDADAETIAGGRLLVTMHFPLNMEVVSGIMRLVARHYPGSNVGENGTIRAKPE
jgi:hypothetical protein